MSHWRDVATAPERQVVDTCVQTPQGNRSEQPLKRLGRLWFLPDDSMYVYYTPTHWRPLSSPDAIEHELTDAVVCPYCAHKHDPDAFNGDDFTGECITCGRTFDGCRSKVDAFSTYRKKVAS